ncbi:hypothetical protein [Fulvivirga kasyanovii]|uniref:hypothetical protein n=1 Tax=Fulvivirga kasyanovii TaxID=396812 RepID=UPI0031DF951C
MKTSNIISFLARGLLLSLITSWATLFLISVLASLVSGRLDLLIPGFILISIIYLPFTSIIMFIITETLINYERIKVLIKNKYRFKIPLILMLILYIIAPFFDLNKEFPKALILILSLIPALMFHTALYFKIKTEKQYFQSDLSLHLLLKMFCDWIYRRR